MRAAAEIDEFSGAVEGNHRFGGLFLHQLAFEFLIALAIELQRLGLGNQLALVGKIFRGQFVHFGFDLFQVVLGERLFAHEFVEKSGVNRRADAELHVGIKFQHGGCKQMRSGMPKHLQRVRIFRGEDGNFGIMLERARKIHQLAIGTRHERFFRQPGRNLARNFRSGRAALHFASGAVRQSDLNGVSAHAWCFSPVETTSLLAGADAVKAACDPPKAGSPLRLQRS